MSLLPGSWTSASEALRASKGSAAENQPCSFLQATGTLLHNWSTLSLNGSWLSAYCFTR